MHDFDVLYGQVWDLLVEFELLKEAGLQPGWSVVEVGCGSGRLAAQLAPWLHGGYLGTDMRPALLEQARQAAGRPDWRFERTLGQTIPAPARSADVVCFFSVFTHLSHEEIWRRLIEAKRVLKPGGKVLASTLDQETFETAAFNAGLVPESLQDGVGIMRKR